MESNNPGNHNNNADNLTNSTNSGQLNDNRNRNENFAKGNQDFKRAKNFTPNYNRDNNSFTQRPIKRNAGAPPRKKPFVQQLPNTIYNAVIQQQHDDFGRKDLRKISNIIKTKYNEVFNETEPEKVEQVERNGQTYQVYCYPETMRKEIKNVVSWYFKVKKERGEKHVITVAREKLEKLRRENSPDYEMALVKYNMAAEERRKQDKLAQAEQAKKAKMQAKYNKNAKLAPPNPNQRKGPNQRNFNPNYKREANQGGPSYNQNPTGRQPFNRDRRFNNDGQAANRNNQYQNRQYNQPNEFNKEAVPPAQIPNEQAVPPPSVTTNIDTVKPKIGFMDRFLNKIKGNDE